MGFFLCECLKKTDFHASDKNITNLYLLPKMFHQAKCHYTKSMKF